MTHKLINSSSFSKLGCAIVLLGALVLTNTNAIAQNNNANPNATGANWKSNGNAAATSDFIGTTNAQDLIFKTNNQERLLLDQTGNLILKDRINPGTGGGGEVIISPGQLHRPLNQNPIAAYMLKVGGSGHFEGQVDALKAIIDEFLWVKGVIKGPRIDVDSIKMDSTRGIYGQTKIVGDLIVKQNLTVDGDVLFRNKLTAEQGLMFNNEQGIKFIDETTTTPAIISLGKQIPNIFQILANNCIAPSQLSPTIFYGGKIQLYDQASNTSLTMGSDGYQSIIESQGNNNLLLNYYCGKDVGICRGPNGGTVKLGKKVDAAQNIRIGYFGADPFIDNTSLSIVQNDLNGTAIKLNVYEGTVKAVNLVNPGNNISNFVVWQNGKTQIGANPTPSSAKLEVNGTGSSLQFFANTNGDIQSTTSLHPHFASNKDYTIYEGNVGSGEAKYSIVNDKHTFYINATRPLNSDAFELWDTYNNKAFFKVKTNGFVYAREVTVTLANTFPDYVFAKDYKLMPLMDVKAFTEKYHHLPNMPTAKTVETEGANLGEIQRVTVEKVEELYKYIFEMEAELKELRKQVGELKNK